MVGPQTTLPLTAAELLSHPWSGISKPNLASAVIACVDTSPSVKSPGYINFSCAVVPGGQETYSKRAIGAWGVGLMIDFVLREHGLFAVDLEWTPSVPYRAALDGDGACSGLTEFVYFVGAGPFVKIGKTTGTPDSRITSLQTGCPFPMVLLAYQPGGIKEEFALHRRFAKYRVRADGEWFRNEGALRHYIASTAAGAVA